MKTTGVSRKVDDLGRIVIPAELRKAFSIREGDYLDISVEGDTILLIKREDVCVFCRTPEDLKEYKNKMICASCIAEVSGGPEIAPNWQPYPAN